MSFFGAKATNPPLVSIIVVTVNTPPLTRACLESVAKNTTVPYELIAVNNSQALAIRRCLKRFSGIRIIQNPMNLGYAKAANQGTLASRGKYLCFLNSDTLVPPGWLERLLVAARKPGVGAVGPITKDQGRFTYGYPYAWPPPWLSINEDTVALIDQAVQRWSNGHTKSTSWLSGYCLLIPRGVIDQVGLFDERFFFAWEDVDYSIRLRFFGYELLQVNSLFVHHTFGASTSQRKRQRLARQAHQELMGKWQSLLCGTISTNPQETLMAIDRGIRSLNRWRRRPSRSSARN